MFSRSKVPTNLKKNCQIFIEANMITPASISCARMSRSWSTLFAIFQLCNFLKPLLELEEQLFSRSVEAGLQYSGATVVLGSNKLS